jgi:hypothetical protein
VTETTHQPDESTIGESAVERPRGKRWQVGLQTVFLLVAAIAVWMTHFVNRRQNAFLEARIAASRPLLRELAIDDPNRIAVVKLQELWSDDNRWDIHLPEGQYRLCLATRAIGSEGFPPVVAKSRVIGAGRHHFVLEQLPQPAGWRVRATWDETGELAVEEPKAWDPGVGSSGGGDYSLSTQMAADQQVVLFRRRFAKRQADGTTLFDPKYPTEGVMLWIESVPETKNTSLPGQ